MGAVSVCTRLAEACGTGDFDDDTLPALVAVATHDPDGFRLLFQHAAREAELRDDMDRFRTAMTDSALAQPSGRVRSTAWRRWAAQLSAVVAVEAIIAWLDAGQPDPDQIVPHIRQILDAIPPSR